jgi:chromosome segregation ATPase
VNREESTKKAQALNVEVNSLRTSLKSAHSLVEEQQTALQQLEADLRWECDEKEAAQEKCHALETSFNTMRYSTQP